MSGNERRPEPKRIAPKGTESTASSSQIPVQSEPQATAAKVKRAQVRAACVACQRGKAKCDGRRPICVRCEKRNVVCQYDVEPDTTRSTSMKKKYDSASTELEQYHDLFEYIRSRSEVDAAEVYRRLRASNDPLSIWRFLKDGDLLLHTSMTNSAGEMLNPNELEDLDNTAYEGSAFKLRAAPWTTLAGDGIVSELVSSFLAHDNGFLFSFIDVEFFIADLMAGNVEQAEWCSPCLVNAICALRCSSSENAKTFGHLSGLDTRDRFYAEAKRMLDREYGRRSLPTVQALLILYMCNVGQGKDRAGSMYRQSAYEMLDRLKLDARFRDPKLAVNETQRHRKQKALSRAAWGIFCFESMTAFSYIQPSMIEAPSMPRRFVDDGGHDPVVIGQGVEPEDPPLSAYTLNAMCDLSIQLLTIMRYNRGNETILGHTIDVETRVELYQELLELSRGLSSPSRSDQNFTLDTMLLSAFEDEIAFSIFRPLNPNLMLPRGFKTPADICLRHCKRSIEGSERYRDGYRRYAYSIMNVFPVYNCAVTLVHLLPDLQSHDLFSRTCVLLNFLAIDFPFAGFLLQGLKAITQRLRLPLPREVTPFFREMQMPSDDLMDVPISFVLPAHAEMAELLSDDGRVSHSDGVELGKLITKWSSLGLSS